MNVTKKRLPCRLLNPTDKIIKLKAHTPVGMLSSITSEQSVDSTSSPEDQILPSVA